MVVINKIDLAEILEFDVNTLVNDIREIDANIPIVSVSSKTGVGLDLLVKELGF